MFQLIARMISSEASADKQQSFEVVGMSGLIKKNSGQWTLIERTQIQLDPK